MQFYDALWHLLARLCMHCKPKPCKSILTGKNLLSLQGNPVLIAGSLFSLQGFPCISLYFPVRDCSVCNKLYTGSGIRYRPNVSTTTAMGFLAMLDSTKR